MLDFEFLHEMVRTRITPPFKWKCKKILPFFITRSQDKNHLSALTGILEKNIYISWKKGFFSDRRLDVMAMDGIVWNIRMTAFFKEHREKKSIFLKP